MRQPHSTSDMEDTSLSLLERARRSDPQSWHRLVRLYGPLVFHWCRRAKLEESDVHDVGQEVFSCVARAIGDFRRDREGDSFRGWLRTITRNKIRDFWRRREREMAAIGGSDHRAWLETQPQPETPEALPLDEDLSDEASICRRALQFIRNDFEERTWQAFWRTAVDDQSAGAVAEELGLTPVAVRKAKSRVLHRLRRELAELVDFA